MAFWLEKNEVAMEHTLTKLAEAIPFRRYIVALGALWTLLVGALLWIEVSRTEQVILELAESEAKAAFNKDIVYRQWATEKGGVYVPVTDKTPPNPYLADIPERDIVTPSGRRLTLINPAYMTRQVHELGLKEQGTHGHITSLKPIRPENAPDLWEIQALKLFESGAKEHRSIESLDGVLNLRYMAPLPVQEPCLQCHASQGYQVGEVRGGISVSIPLQPYLAVYRSRIIATALGFGLLWMFGMAGLGLSSLSLSKHIAVYCVKQ